MASARPLPPSSSSGPSFPSTAGMDVTGVNLPLVFGICLPMVGSAFVRYMYTIISSKPSLSKDWYNKRLKKPWFTPPNWAFPITWMLFIYPAIGYATYLVWEEQRVGGPGGEPADGTAYFGAVAEYFRALVAPEWWREALSAPPSSFPFLPRSPPALLLFSLQLLLNWTWTPIFFGERFFLVGLVWMVAMEAVVIWCGSLFYRINSTAGLLMMPYALWLGFLTLLTFFIWKNNRGARIVGRRVGEHEGGGRRGSSQGRNKKRD